MNFCKQHLDLVIFYLFFFAIFLLEGLGIKQGQAIALFLIIAMPFFLFLRDLSKKNKVCAPKNITFLYIIFLLFSTISTIFSVNIQQSFEYLLFYISLYLILIYVYNHKKRLAPHIFIIIFSLSFIFSTYSFIIQREPYLSLVSQIQSNFLYPNYQLGYNLVYPYYLTHNLLGDFLLIPLALCFYFVFSNKLTFFSVLAILTLFPFFLLSYSRSAYVSLMATLLILGYYLVKSGKKNLIASKRVLAAILGSILIALVVSTSVLVFFASVEEALPYPPLSRVTVFLKEHTNLQYKTFWSILAM